MKNDGTPAPDSVPPKAQGTTTVESRFDPKVTMDRLGAAIQAHGMEVFICIDHAAGAAEAGLELLPTELVIFGNARAGTPLMQANQMIGIDLPLKALVWQDPAGKTWVTYVDPRWIAHRYELGGGIEPIIERMAALLAAVVGTAVNF